MDFMFTRIGIRLHCMQIVIIMTTLMSDYCAGITVLAADPLKPDYFRTDLGATATLQCPGVLNFPTAVKAVNWFVGNGTNSPVALDDDTTVDTDGKLVIKVVESRDAGWYSCQYTSPNGLMTGLAHLNVVGR